MNRNGLLLVLLGTLLVFAGSSVSLLKRHRVERRNATVTIAVESDIVSQLAAGSRVNKIKAMNRLKAGGIGGLVVGEEGLGELISSGRAALSSHLPDGERAERRQTNLVLYEAGDLPRVQRGLALRFGKDKVPAPIVLMENGGYLFSLPAETVIGLLRGTSLGLPPEECDAARAAGMRIMARANNPSGANTEVITETIRGLKANGASVFLPQGDTVLGRRDGTEAAVAALRETGILYASPEFAKLGGDTEMLKAMPDRTVRLHSAQSAELDKLSPGAAVERYTKAASERNMRILLLRPMSVGGADPLGSFVDFAGQIVKAMARDGLQPGEARPFEDPAPPAWTRFLIGTGIAVATAGTAVLLDLSGVWLILAGVAAVGSVLAVLKPSLSELSALWGTLVFPFAGFLAAFRGKMRLPLALVVATGVSLAGGLCVAGLLNGLPYLVRADTFNGVKLAVFLPVVAVGVYAFSRLADLKTAMKEPITWGSALLGLALLVGLMVLLIRSGNDSPAGVSGGELALRGALEDLLPVRPRTKSFLIGFPALFLGFAWLSSVGYDPARLKGRGGWVALFLMGGAVALTDTVNTFCHLHTPLTISALRVLLGFIIGTFGGAILWVVSRRFLNRA